MLLLLLLVETKIRCRGRRGRRLTTLASSGTDTGTGTGPRAPLTTRRVRHFINLTNGLELLGELIELGHDPDSIAFCRIQSSHCERCDFAAVLQNLDHNLLLRLAMGDVVVVYDCGSRGMSWPKPKIKDGPSDDQAKAEAEDGGGGGSEFEREFIPRALWWGLEWTR